MSPLTSHTPPPSLQGTVATDGGTHYPKRSHSFSPEPSNTAVPDKECSDLDFGPLKRSSPQVGRKGRSWKCVHVCTCVLAGFSPVERS